MSLFSNEQKHRKVKKKMQGSCWDFAKKAFFPCNYRKLGTKTIRTTISTLRRPHRRQERPLEYDTAPLALLLEPQTVQSEHL